ncbi:MAG TPA: F0F1 ATP synthase subunit B [Blastocatellia bacterium]|nr:F0F1 ATP synthase subunit B [Blastocatellia bacterium]
MIAYSFFRPALLLAAEQAEATGLASPSLWRVINFLVFVIILVYILRNKIGIGRLFDNRADSIATKLEQATRDKREAQERLSELEARLGRLDQEVAEIRVEAERESAREAERIRLAAEADAEKIRQTAQREIEGAMNAARNDLRAFVAEQSVSLAERIITREIRPDDNTAMLNRFVDNLDEVRK